MDNPDKPKNSDKKGFSLGNYIVICTLLFIPTFWIWLTSLPSSAFNGIQPRYDETLYTIASLLQWSIPLLALVSPIFFGIKFAKASKKHDALFLIIETSSATLGLLIMLAVLARILGSGMELTDET